MNHLFLSGTDLIGLNRLAADGVIGVTGVAQAMHDAVLCTPGLSLASTVTRPFTSAAYGPVRTLTRVFSGVAETLIAPLLPVMSDTTPRAQREAMLAAINGVVGDHLQRTENPLAIQMRMRRFGRCLTVQREALTRAIPNAGGKILVQVHGLCMNDIEWTRGEHNHGHALEADAGWTTIDLHYNSGLHISENGRRFSAVLEQLIREWPVEVEELAIVAHSAGGLVTRSACHCGQSAGYRWPDYLRNIVFLGTPHHGAALERHGNWFNQLLGITPYSAPLGRLLGVRSSGITDLRYGCIIDEHWQGVHRFHDAGDTRDAVPLPMHTRCFAIAGTTSNDSALDASDLAGDGLVSVNSALGRHDDTKLTLPIETARQRVAYATNHFQLLSSPEVYEQLKSWLNSEAPSKL